MADQRQKIIASVFSRRNASGNLEESYVSHLKIWEDAEGGRKPRYILLSQTNTGSGFIHKSKLNTNGTFSVGKTWRLVELRAINVISPSAFNLTLSRTYRWQTENKEDQVNFLEDLVRLFRIVTNGQASLHLDGVQDFDISAANSHPDSYSYSADSAITKSRIPNRTNSPTPSLTSKIPALQKDNPSTTSLDVVANRKDHSTRISYFDPSNQAAVDRLIVGAAEAGLDGESEEENAQATLANVEEMIEGYEWASEDAISRKVTKGAVDLIEARLHNELMALEKANIHSFLESDDRLALLMKCMDEAISEIDNMESLISTYKIHLNTVNDDILYIQSQNKGLQVQTQNQRALLGELQNLRTAHVDEDTLATLSQK